MLEINEVEYCKVNVKYTANHDVVIEKTNEAIKELRKLPIPGFRANKAPDLAIKAKYKLKIHQWVKQQMLNHAFEDILFETKIQPIGSPQALDVKLDGNNFNCELLLFKKPEFELQEVKGLEIPKPHQKITQEAYVQELIQELRAQHGDSVPYGDNDFVQVGDVVTLDYKLTNDGVDSLEEGKLYTVGQNLLPEFDDNIIGMVPGETREFNVPIEEKKATVSVTLHMGMKKTLAPLDDSLAIKVGIENYNKLLEVIEGVATNRLKQYADGQIAEQIKQKLFSLHSFELPEWLIQMEQQELASKMGLKLNELSEDMKETFTSRAKESVKFALILDAIRSNVPEANLSDNEVINLIKQRVSGQVENPDAFIMDLQTKGQLVNTVASIRNEITLQFLIQNAKIVE